MNAPLIVAGSLAILGAAVHGVGGEVLVVRKLSPGMLPSSRFGGPRMTKSMIHVTWHMTTIALLAVGTALLLSGSVLHGDVARGIGLAAAGASTGFAVVALGLGAAYTRSPLSLVLHPGPRRAHGHRDAGVVGSSLMSRWAILYDADCGFCMWLLSVLLRWDRAARLQPIALQRSEADDLLKALTPAERMASWHLISPGGERHSGGAALPPLLRLLPAGRLPAAGFARFPRLTDRGYRWVAEHRPQLSRWMPSSAKQRATQRVQKRERAARLPDVRGGIEA